MQSLSVVYNTSLKYQVFPVSPPSELVDVSKTFLIVYTSYCYYNINSLT